MEELYLDREELLVLLDAVGAGAVVGLKQDVLFPESLEEHRRLVARGHEKLAARGLLRQNAAGAFELPELLLMIATVVGSPDLAVVSSRDVPGRGRQLFLHYIVGEFVVEQTLPDERRHRLATLPNRAALVPRLLAIFPIEQTAHVGAQVALDQAQCSALMGEARTERPAALARLARAGLSGEPAERLVETLAEATLSGDLALLRLAGNTITDGRNPVLALGPRSAWVFFQTVPGGTEITLASVDAERLGALLAGWVAELAGGATTL